ncbi:MAG: ABC transporter permease, partial [Nitrososphaerales archaeon]
MESRLLRYVILKLALTIPTILTLLHFIFFILHILPGDPAIALLGANANDAQLKAIEKQYGFDLPIYQQFINYFGQLLHGNLGMTITQSRTVLQTIVVYLPNTIELAIA